MLETHTKSPQLSRRLGSWACASLVIGTVIGTGVFLKTAVMAQAAGSAHWVMAAWLVAGGLSLAGALSYAELSSLFPQAGGEYVFLREGYGSFVAFLYGWTRFWIASPGSIAAYAVGAATFCQGLFPVGEWRAVLAVSLIAVFSLVNCLSVTVGGRVQTALTALKLLLILGLAAAIFAAGGDSGAPSLALLEGRSCGWSAFGAAVLAALWAFDGWNNLPMAAGEVRDPRRNLPRALALGMLAVLGVYLIANLAYFHALTWDEIRTANSTAHPDAPAVATRAAERVLGPAAASLLSAAFVISALGAMSGAILTGARVPFAMATDGVFFRALSRIHPRTHVPAAAVLAQAVVASALAMHGSFDQLTDYVVFSSWIFYGLCTGAVFTFRSRRGGGGPVFHAPGYPWLPALFLVGCALLLVNSIFVSPRESLLGLGLIALGAPVYFLFRRSGARAQTRGHADGGDQ